LVRKEREMTLFSLTATLMLPSPSRHTRAAKSNIMDATY
jgi:hypothetical protein